jgi:hypothetical protein
MPPVANSHTSIDWKLANWGEPGGRYMKPSTAPWMVVPATTLLRS